MAISGVPVWEAAPHIQTGADGGIHRPWLAEGPQWPPFSSEQNVIGLPRQQEEVAPEPPPALPAPPIQNTKPISFGSHISQEMIDKIVRGDFLDIFSLLNKEIDRAKIKHNDQEKERVRKKNPD